MNKSCFVNERRRNTVRGRPPPPPVSTCGWMVIIRVLEENIDCQRLLLRHKRWDHAASVTFFFFFRAEAARSLLTLNIIRRCRHSGRLPLAIAALSLKQSHPDGWWPSEVENSYHVSNYLFQIKYSQRLNLRILASISFPVQVCGSCGEPKRKTQTWISFDSTFWKSLPATTEKSTVSWTQNYESSVMHSL